MLTPETKRKIDNCRDTLVGKIPVPMSQIEQITLALTYKFMSDIDEENRELGWASFFEWDFEKYAWKNIMDKRNGAQERLNLYSEGLDSMSRNGNIPDLFRDIFRNAYLPFKDPTTLDRFLKQIDEFHYEHSEELGNAFEYLLSTAGSQGDAGQFRTPRHIIDFLVSVVEPTKDDTILDPACGTAGFLISAYKHILEQNGKNLSIEDKQKISKNISGYDISHDMVRLSLVNMYLHNFADPKIYEYDTLSSEERWHDDFDCILANPPFMTPKGGSQPHKRFSITSTKSEVLFVDYIMEHMKIHGKAGIIVPEGVIFQSGKSYKELRENMVKNNFLWAVVSLPSGVFQPYSGVKTTILFFDRQLAKKTDKILFVNVSTDGYDLGAQRRIISSNDLPEAFEIIKWYKDGIEKNNIESIFSPLAHLVEKSRIAESGEYSLSGERYRTTGIIGQSDWEMVKLGDTVDFQNWYAFQSEKYSDTGFQVIRITNVQKWFIDPKGPKFYPDEEINNLKDFILNKGDLLMSLTGNVWRVWILQADHLPAVLNQRVAKLQINDTSKLSKSYLFHILNSDRFETDAIDLSGGVAQKNLWTGSLKDYKIPLPPLEIQEQIVVELDGYKQIIDGARAVVENYKPIIKINADWEIVEFNSLCEIVRWSSPRPAWDAKYYGPWVPRLMVWDITRDWMYTIPKIDSLTPEWAKHSRPMKKWDLIMAVSGQPWVCCILWVDACIHDWFAGFRNLDNTRVTTEFAYFILMSMQEKHNNESTWAIFRNLNTDQIRNFKIPLPPLEVQESIVDRIENEQKLINSTKEIISIYEGKIKERIGEVWGENNSI